MLEDKVVTAFLDLAKNRPSVAEKLKEVLALLPEVQEQVQAQATQVPQCLGYKLLMGETPAVQPTVNAEQMKLFPILAKDGADDLKEWIGCLPLKEVTVVDCNGEIFLQPFTDPTLSTRPATLLELAARFRAQRCVSYLINFQQMSVTLKEACAACVGGDLELMRTMWNRLPQEVKDVKTRLALIDAAITGQNETALQWLLDDALWGGASLSQEDIQYVVCPSRCEEVVHRCANGTEP